jgi:peptidyl-prolyl cis-trans isomerase SurA
MMKKVFPFCWILLLCMGSQSVPASNIIDRIVATVNGHIILQSDWEEAVRYEAFVDGRPLDRMTAEDRKAALDRLIDQELLREQVRAPESPQAPANELNERIDEIRKQYPRAETEAGWADTLGSYGLTLEELKKRLAIQLELTRLVDARLRPGIDIDSKSVESYYNQELLPQLRQAGVKAVPLNEVTPKIKELLTQEKVSELLTAWLQNLRSGSEIHTEDLPSRGANAQ